MNTFLVDWLFIAGLILLPVGAGMLGVGLYVHTFRAALVGVGCLIVAAIVLLTVP